MRRKTRKALKLTADRAAAALQLLLEEGKIAAADVTRALQRREKTIQAIRERLAALGEASGPATRRFATAGRTAARRALPRARKTITRAQRVARQAQGRYMAAIRRLSEDARAKVREVRKQSGVDSAIQAARKMAK